MALRAYALYAHDAPFSEAGSDDREENGSRAANAVRELGRQGRALPSSQWEKGGRRRRGTTIRSDPRGVIVSFYETVDR